MPDLTGGQISHKGQKIHKSYKLEGNKNNKKSPMMKYTEIDLHLPTFKSMKEEYENGERRRSRFKVSLRQEVTKASKIVDCVALAESR